MMRIVWQSKARKLPVYAAALSVLLAASAGCGGAASTDSAGDREGAEGAKTTALAIDPVDAERLLEIVSESESEAVMVNVWATWCIPCREEFPDLVRVHRELGDDGFSLVLVSGDFDTQMGEVEAFLTEQGVDFPTYIKAEKDMPFIDALSEEWSGALPATFLYDGDGVLRDFWEGKADYETLHRKVSSLLEESN